MNYQLLALDLDGTNSRKEITPSTRDALIDIQKNGKKVVLASGRPSQGVLPLAEELHLGDYGSYILSYNGGRITDCRSGEIIYSKYLPNDVAAPLLEIVLKNNFTLICLFTAQIRSFSKLCPRVLTKLTPLQSCSPASDFLPMP